MLRRQTLTGSGHGLLMAASLLICVASVSAQTTPAAKLIAMTGRVSVLRGSEAWALNLNDAVQPKQVIITGPDGFARFQVSDGSIFEVFPNSRTTFRANPGDWKDLLDVLLGRVKVHIEKLNGQPNHNKVTTPTAVISVRGTTFDVDVEDEDATTLVSVEEGTVWVEHRLLYNGYKELKDGEWIRVFKNQPLAVKQFDKGGALRAMMRAAAQAMYDVIYRQPGSPGGGGSVPASTGGGGGGTGTADKDKGTAPPTAPPPPGP